MGKFKDFTINLNENKDQYRAGEIVFGNVTLSLSSPMPMLRLISQIEGKARCTNGSTLNEQIHNDEVTLFGTPPSATRNVNMEHPGGTHTYPFHFQLPAKLPTSIQESNGDIKYKITARIIFRGLKGLISKDWRVSKLIHVTEIIDGNKEEHKNPMKAVIRKTPGYFSKKNLQKEDLLVTMEHSMYCPGEKIKINIKYKDVAARKMGTIKSRLNKYVLFNPKENKRRYGSKKVISEVSDEKISGRIYQRILNIPIPDKVSPTNVLTRAIKLNYTVHIKIDGYPELKLPVTIGTKKLIEETISQAQLHSEVLQSFEVIDQEVQPVSNLPLHPISTQPTINAAMSTIPQLSQQHHRPPPLSPSAPPYSEFDESEWSAITFMYPPEYVPENEFDLPPSYAEAVGGI